MRFTPKSEAEVVSDTLFPAGIYPFEVISAADKISKAGNEMIELKIMVYGNDGDTTKVFDYLMEKVAYKLRHFAETVGLLSKYELGVLEAADCEGRTGYCKLVIDNKDPAYLPKNSVKDYGRKEAADQAKPMTPANPSRPAMSQAHRASMDAQAPAPAVAGDFDDDMPF